LGGKSKIQKFSLEFAIWPQKVNKAPDEEEGVRMERGGESKRPIFVGRGNVGKRQAWGVQRICRENSLQIQKRKK